MKQDYLDVQAVAELLHRSRSGVYALTKRTTDPLPGKRIGGTLLFRRADVDAWIERQPGIAAENNLLAFPARKGV